jgi:3-hydroxymyristoyl/3-hydroxydecanoyl-(acyl carrier protein) dehydratase
MLEFSATTTVASDHPCLAGHFPGHPVVPAVLLLERVADALREHLGGIAITGAPSAKFLAPVLPQQTLQVHLRADAARGRATFRCEHQGRLMAQGELAFTAGSGTRP